MMMSTQKLKHLIIDHVMAVLCSVERSVHFKGCFYLSQSENPPTSPHENSKFVFVCLY